MNIYLIGFRCAGKSSVGTSLAAVLDWNFIDLDDLLVETEKLSIAEIVANHGWSIFRQKEKNLLARVSAMTRHVVATGGGVVLDNKNVDLMKKTGRVIWLKAEPDTIRRRMLLNGKTTDFRPALSSKGAVDEIKETLTKRVPLYQNAKDMMVETDTLSTEQICRVLKRYLEKEQVIIG
jgi:shikimate kinase